MREEPIVSCECNEPGGLVTRHVYPMILTHENLLRFWQQASKFRVLFSDEIPDFKRFCELFISIDNGDSPRAHGLFWRIDDFVGMFYMTHIQANDAQIHYTFFDRRQRGRAELCRMMIKYVFDTFHFRRLSSEIPYFRQPNRDEKEASEHNRKKFTFGPFGFACEVGMTPEGRKRKAQYFNGEWWDTQLFGILREETEKWDTTKRMSVVDQQQVLQPTL